MSSINDELGVQIGFKFESEKEVLPKVKNVLDKIGQNVDLKVHFGVDKNELNKILESTSKINKTNITLDENGNALRAITEINTGLNQTLKLIQDTKGNKINISNDFAKNEKIQLDESLKLLQQEYQIKNQLLTADGKYKEVLSEQLSLNQKIQNVVTNDNTSKKLLNEKVQLEERYQQNLAKTIDSKNRQLQKDKEEQAEMQRMIALEKQRLSNKILLYKNKYKGNEDVDSLAKTTQAINNLGKSSNNLQDLRKEIKGVSQDIQNMETKTKISTGNISKHDDMSFLNNLKANINSLSSYLIGGSLLYSVGNTFREAIDYVIELDSCMTNLKKVTDETEGTYRTFLNTAHDLAMEFGSQSDKVVQATTSWAKTGKTLQESTELAKSTMLLTKVGDIENVDTAQKFMIAPLKAFNIEAEKSINLIDKYNNLSNNMATDTIDLGEALSQSASMLSTAGNDINQSLALISTAESTTKLGGSTIGNALKTISLRIAEFKDENGEMIPKFEENMKNLGVTMRDSQGQIKSTFDILMEASEKYKTFDKNNQLALAEELGGKRQANIVSAILTNADELKRAYDLASNSSGSAMQEFGKYQESIQYSIDRMKEQMNELYTNLANSSFLKGIAETGSTVLGIINKAVDSFGALPTALTIAGTAFLTFNKNANQMTKSLMGDIKGINTLQNSLTGLEGKLTSQISSLRKNIELEQEMAKIMKDSSVSTSGLGTSLLGLNTKLALTEIKLIGVKLAGMALQTLFSFGLSLAISTIISGLGKFINTLTEVKDSADNIASVKQQITELNTATQNLKGMDESLFQYSEIKKQLEDTNLTVEQRNKLEEECSQIKQNIIGIDADAGAILDNNNLTLETQVGLLREMVKLKQQEKADEMEKEMSKGKVFGGKSTEERNIEDSADVMDYYIKKYKELIELQKQSQGKDISFEGKTLGLEEQNKLMDEYSSKIKEQYTEIELHNSKVQAVIDANGECSISYKNLSDDVKNFVNNLLGADDIIANSATNSKNKLNDMSENGVDSTTTNYKVDEITNALVSLGYTADEVKDKMKDMNITDGLASTDVISEATTRFGEVTNSIQSAYEMIEKLNEAGSMTPSLMADIAKQYPDIGANIFQVSDAQEFLNGKIADMESIQSDAIQIMRGNDQSYYQELLSQGNSLQDAVDNWASNFIDINSESYRINVNDFQTLNEAKSGIAGQLTNALAEYIAKWTNDDAEKYAIDLSSFTSLAQQKVYVLQKLDDEIAKVQQNYNNLISSTAHKAGNQLLDASKKLGNPMLTDRLNMQFNGLSDMMSERLQNLQNERQKVNASFSQFNKTFAKTSPNLSWGKGDYLAGGKGSGSKGGSGSKASEKQVEDIDNLKDRYYELDLALQKVENSMAMLNTQMKNAKDEEKIKLIKEEVALLTKKKQALENIYKEQQKEIQDYRNALYSQGGFTFNGDDTIHNYSEKMDKLQSWANSFSNPDDKKNAQDQYQSLAKMVEEYTQLISKTVPETKEKIEDIQNAITSAYQEEADIMKKQVDKHKELLNKRYEDTKKSIDRERDLLNRKWDSEDKQDDISEKQRKLNELKAELDNALRTGDESLIKNIQLQMAEAQKELDNYIRDTERDKANQMFEDEQNALDEELQRKLDMIEEKLGDEDLLQYAMQGITDLTNVITDIDKTTTGVNRSFMMVSDTVTSIGDNIKTSWISGLDEVSAKIKEMSSELNNSFDFGNVQPILNGVISPITTDLKGKNQEITLNFGGIEKLDITKTNSDEIKNALEDNFNKIIKEVMNIIGG